MMKKPSQLVQDFVNCMVWCNSSSFIGFLVFCTASDCISRSYWDHVMGPWSKRSALFDLHCACYFIKWLSNWMPTWCSLTKFHGNVMPRHEFLGHAACLWGTWAVAEDGQECHRRLTRCRRQADEWMHCNQQPLSIDIQWFTAFLGNDPLERCNMFVVHAKFKLSSCHLLVAIIVKSMFASLLWTTGVPSASLQHTPPSLERDSINQKPHPCRFCCRVQKTYPAPKATSGLSALGLAYRKSTK